MFVCMRPQGLDHTHAHTHNCVFFNLLLLPCPQVHYSEAEVMTQAHRPLLSTHSLPLLTPLVTSWFTVGGSEVPL